MNLIICFSLGRLVWEMDWIASTNFLLGIHNFYGTIIPFTSYIELACLIDVLSFRLDQYKKIVCFHHSILNFLFDGSLLDSVGCKIRYYNWCLSSGQSTNNFRSIFKRFEARGF